MREMDKTKYESKKHNNANNSNNIKNKNNTIKFRLCRNYVKYDGITY